MKKSIILFILVLFTFGATAQNDDVDSSTYPEIELLHYQQSRLLEASRKNDVGEELSWVQFQLNQWYNGKLVKHHIIKTHGGSTVYIPISDEGDSDISFVSPMGIGRDTIMLISEPINYEKLHDLEDQSTNTSEKMKIKRMIIRCNEEAQLKFMIEELKKDDFILEGEVEEYFNWKCLDFWYRAKLKKNNGIERSKSAL